MEEAARDVARVRAVVEMNGCEGGNSGGADMARCFNDGTAFGGIEGREIGSRKYCRLGEGVGCRVGRIIAGSGVV